MPAPKVPIALVLLDVDGVLTDGTVRYSAAGSEQKSLFMRDVDAVFEARRRGARVGLVTGENSHWVDFVAKRLEVGLIMKGAKDKLAAVRQLASAEGAALEAVCYVGDGDRDAPALAAVGLGLAPSDASAEAKAAARKVLSCPGGRGAVAEAIRLVLRSREARERTDPDHAAKAGAADRAVDAVRRIVAESVALQQAVAAELAPATAAAARVIAEALAAGGKVLIFGNGGSAADAEHMAAELVGRFERERPGLPAVALTANSSALTALGNDFGGDEIFARQVEALGRPGDAAVAISTSGLSPNVVLAAHRARDLGLRVVALTGAGGGDLAQLADHCLAVPSSVTARIQEAHILLIHAICSIVDTAIGNRGPDESD
jgi:D-sedoheptulose 7-phosphate isomerase